MLQVTDNNSNWIVKGDCKLSFCISQYRLDSPRVPTCEGEGKSVLGKQPFDRGRNVVSDHTSGDVMPRKNYFWVWEQLLQANLDISIQHATSRINVDNDLRRFGVEVMTGTIRNYLHFHVFQFRRLYNSEAFWNCSDINHIRETSCLVYMMKQH